MRGSGILLPVSSLPSPYGIGSLGLEARRFADFLRAAGQRYWQILPIGPTGYGDSPYQSFSAFAGNPYWIDLDELIADGLLSPRDAVSAYWGSSADRVDYGALAENRLPVLRKATRSLDPTDPAFLAFAEAHDGWLDNYALFMAIKRHLDMQALLTWPLTFRMRDPAALAVFRDAHAGEILFWKQVQFLFDRQWQALRAYLHQNGIAVIGDLPIYVSPDSADLWGDPDLFQTDGQLGLREVAGVPPDPYAPGGQLWGNPLFDWPRHVATGFAWWVRRLLQAGKFFDQVRIDHFRGIAGYYAIPGGDCDAVRGVWRPGPGLDFIRTIRKELPDLGFIAEDLGVITPDVRQLLTASGFPGMQVLQFAFESRTSSDYKPYAYPRNTVVYTGTHDNPPSEAWLQIAPPEQVRLAMEYLDVRDPADFTGCLIRAALSSVADTCIIPLQDYLGLGAESRLNTPGTPVGNWQWRVSPAALSADLAASIRSLAELYGRFLPDMACLL